MVSPVIGSISFLKSISCLFNRSFMDPSEPFRIPDDICDQVAEFEALYNNNTSSSSTYQRTLDNYPDPTYESLYEYVAISTFIGFFVKLVVK